jgi:hypothetical protein
MIRSFKYNGLEKFFFQKGQPPVSNQPVAKAYGSSLVGSVHHRRRKTWIYRDFTCTSPVESIVADGLFESLVIGVLPLNSTAQMR